MRPLSPRLAAAALLLVGAAPLAAQDFPTSQPKYLTIVREEVKVGRDADHARVEAGWPAAFERAKSPDYYLAMTSMTGAHEAWFIIPSASNAAIADGMKRVEGDAKLVAELDRLAKADAELLTNHRIMMAMGRPDLSSGAYPDIGKQRFWEITWFRVRPGHEQQFEATAKTYAAAAKRAAPTNAWRVFEIMAGVPGPTYLVFSSVESYDKFDVAMDDGMKLMSAFTPDEMASVQKFATEGLINAETQRFRLDPRMSYVSKAVRATDPAFWGTAKKTVTASAAQP